MTDSAQGIAPLNTRDLWPQLRATYLDAWSVRQSMAIVADPVAAGVARLVRIEMNHWAGVSTDPVPEAAAEAAANPRVGEWASRVIEVMRAENRGLAATWVGFDRLRDGLDAAGFTRAVSWRLCVALRRAGVIADEPNRPYLAGRGQRLVHRLLLETGLRARSVEDLEAALMIAGETRLVSLGQRLDAEVLTYACGRLARMTGD